MRSAVHQPVTAVALAAHGVRVLLAVGSVLVVLVAGAGSAAAVEADGIRVDPTDPSSLGAGSVLRPAIPPGGAATYSLTLRNQRDQSVDVLVYGADATGGEVATGTDNTGVGAWITASERRVPLEPQASTTVEVTITRPSDDEAGGTGAIVAQLSDQSRRNLGLTSLQRAALLVEVAADGAGDGLHVVVAETDPSAGLVPGVLTVTVGFSSPSAADETVFDGSVSVLRPLVGDPSFELTPTLLPPGDQLTTTVEIDLPWYGLIGHLQAEAASVAVTSLSPPVRVVIVPPWLVLLLVVIAAVAMWRGRRSDTPFELGRVPGFGGGGGGGGGGGAVGDGEGEDDDENDVGDDVRE